MALVAPSIIYVVSASYASGLRIAEVINTFVSSLDSGCITKNFKSSAEF
jgi:hypothetical protein